MTDGIINPRGDAPLYKIFTSLADAMAEYQAMADAVGQSLYEPDLPGIRESYSTDTRTIVAHPTLNEWSIVYDRLAQQLLSPTGTISSLPAGWTDARTHSDIVLATFGQSNALGQNNNPAAPTIWTDSTVSVQIRYWAEDAGSYFAGTGTASATGTTGGGLVNLSNYTAGNDRFSPDNAYARVLKQAGYGVACSRAGQGSTNLFSDWNASNPGAKDLYQVAKGELDAAIPQIIAGGHVNASNYRLVLVWIQGEADAASSLHSGEPSGDTYRDNLLDLWDTFATDFASHSPTGVIIQLDSASTTTYVSAIRTAQTNAVAARPALTLIDPSPIGLGAGDGLHRTPANNIELGRLVAEAVAAGA